MDLKTLLDLQHDLQVEAYGKDPGGTLEGDELLEYVRYNVLALQDELHEAMGEISWKPWAVGFRFDREAWVGELVDLLHFFVNLLLIAAPEPGEKGRLRLALEVSERYQQKRRRNLERQLEGYDGVTGKCPHCHRDLGDVPVTEVDGNQHCGGCGAFLSHLEPPRERA